MKKIALLTSGGDAPGMNAAIRAIVNTSLHYNITPLGILDGYQGMIHGTTKEMKSNDVQNIIQLGGTLLGTARCDEFKTSKGRQQAIEFLRQNQLDGLIVIGGDGTFKGAEMLSKEMNIPIIGIPATIDNDIEGTDFTIGFDTAINTAISAIDKIRDTASSHHRVFFVEVMGKTAGFIALASALASAADFTLIPEEKTNIEQLATMIKSKGNNQNGIIVIVAEGDDAGNSLQILTKIKPLLPTFELRHSVLGHMQRGGSPSASDRILATKMGTHAVELLKNEQSNLVIGTTGLTTTTYPISAAIKKKASPTPLYFHYTY